MAKRGTGKALSVEHEEFIARLFGGRRSRSSGAAAHDPGDVRTEHLLFECKMTGNPSEISKKSAVARNFEKIAEEAYSVGKTPALALRHYDPDSILANSDGWVDLIVMRAQDVN